MSKKHLKQVEFITGKEQVKLGSQAVCEPWEEYTEQQPELVNEENVYDMSESDQETLEEFDKDLEADEKQHTTTRSIVASVAYVNGYREKTVAIDDIRVRKGDPSRLLWIGLKNPTAEELARVCKNLKIQGEAQEELNVKHKKPRMVNYGEYVHIVAVIMHKGHKKLSMGEMQMLFGDGFILTVRRGGAMSNSVLRNRLEACPDLIARGADFVVSEILDVLADSYLTLASKLESEVNHLEHRLMLEDNKFIEDDVRHLYNHRRDLLRIHTAMAPMIEICRKLSIVRIPLIEEDSRSSFSVVSDRIARVDEQINSLRETLAFAFEASMMIGQSRQTDITKKLAAWAAILAVPTAIAGIYGMNFEGMPELSWRFGYPLVMTLMFVICSILFWRFKKSDWL